jgi:hypothetical protein
VPYKAASQIIKLLNNEGPIMVDMMQQNAFLQPPEIHAARFRPHLLSTKPNAFINQHHAQTPLKNSDPELETFPGYTTKDDAGTDGDDTVHTAIEFYNVPNCIQSVIGFDEEQEPQTVDLMYNEFIQKWVLLALEYTGQKYSSDDTRSWNGGKSFTDIMTEWVSEKWGEEEC